MSQPPYDGPSNQYPQQDPTYPSQPPGPAPYAQPGAAAGQPYGSPPPYGTQQPYGSPQPYGQMPPAPAGFGTDTAKRPGTVTAAAVLAFVIGGIYVIGGLIAVFGGAAAGLSGFFTLIAVVLLAVGGLLIWGGIATLNGKDARILTIAIGVGIVLNLISLLGNFEGRSLAGFVIPGLILYFLLNAAAKAWFDRVGAKHF